MACFMCRQPSGHHGGCPEADPADSVGWILWYCEEDQEYAVEEVEAPGSFSSIEAAQFERDQLNHNGWD